MIGHTPQQISCSKDAKCGCVPLQTPSKAICTAISKSTQVSLEAKGCPPRNFSFFGSQRRRRSNYAADTVIANCTEKFQIGDAIIKQRNH